MKFTEKGFGAYWKVIKLPVYIFIAWSIVGFVVALNSFATYNSWFSGAAGYIVTIAIFGVLGYLAVVDHKFSIKQASWAGAMTGIISGLFGAVIGILMVNMVPQIIEAAVSQAAARGATDTSMIEGMVKIMTYVGLVTGPLFSGLIGAAISALGGLVAKKTG